MSFILPPCPDNVNSLDWWFSWEVQDFIQLVLRTGGHIEHRWVDVATQSMVRHLFCPDTRFLPHHEDFEVKHGRGECGVCGEGWAEETRDEHPSPSEGPRTPRLPPKPLEVLVIDGNPVNIKVRRLLHHSQGRIMPL